LRHGRLVYRKEAKRAATVSFEKGNQEPGRDVRDAIVKVMTIQKAEQFL